MNIEEPLFSCSLYFILCKHSYFKCWNSFIRKRFVIEVLFSDLLCCLINGNQFKIRRTTTSYFYTSCFVPVFYLIKLEVASIRKYIFDLGCWFVEGLDRQLPEAPCQVRVPAQCRFLNPGRFTTSNQSPRSM